MNTIWVGIITGAFVVLAGVFVLLVLELKKTVCSLRDTIEHSEKYQEHH